MGIKYKKKNLRNGCFKACNYRILFDDNFEYQQRRSNHHFLCSNWVLILFCESVSEFYNFGIFARLKVFVFLHDRFAVITLLTYAIQFYVRSQIVKVNNKTEFTCKESELTPPNPYGASDATPEDKDVTMTTADYDLDQWKKGVTATIFPTCFILVLHFYFGFLPPLIFSPVNGFYDMFSQPLVRVYLLKEVKEDLAKRPFVKPKQEGLYDVLIC